MITQKESWLNPNVEIKNSKVQGKGMFAKTQIKKGEIVYIWGGIFKTKKVTNGAALLSYFLLCQDSFRKPHTLVCGRILSIQKSKTNHGL